MIEVRQTSTFAKWFRSLSDENAKARIAIRIRRLSLGNPGDVKPVGNGSVRCVLIMARAIKSICSEGDAIVILLTGGDKRSQKRNIEAARTLARELE